MNFQDIALPLAERGFRVFPVIPKEKRPFAMAGESDHFDAATTDTGLDEFCRGCALTVFCRYFNDRFHESEDRILYSLAPFMCAPQFRDTDDMAGVIAYLGAGICVENIHDTAILQ